MTLRLLRHDAPRHLGACMTTVYQGAAVFRTCRCQAQGYGRTKRYRHQPQSAYLCCPVVLLYGFAFVLQSGPHPTLEDRMEVESSTKSSRWSSVRLVGRAAQRVLCVMISELSVT